MAQNVSQELFTAIVKANASEMKAGFENVGVWMDWDLNNGVLKGNFTIPVEKLVDENGRGFKVIAKDFLNYTGN